MNQEIRTAATVLARSKMDGYKDTIAFTNDRKNAEYIASWMSRLLGHTQETASLIAALEKVNMIQVVGKLMELAIMSGPGSLGRSIARDIEEQYMDEVDEPFTAMEAS